MNLNITKCERDLRADWYLSHLGPHTVWFLWQAHTNAPSHLPQNPSKQCSAWDLKWSDVLGLSYMWCLTKISKPPSSVGLSTTCSFLRGAWSQCCWPSLYLASCSKPQLLEAHDWGQNLDSFHLKSKVVF